MAISVEDCNVVYDERGSMVSTISVVEIEQGHTGRDTETVMLEPAETVIPSTGYMMYALCARAAIAAART